MRLVHKDETELLAYQGQPKQKSTKRNGWFGFTCKRCGVVWKSKVTPTKCLNCNGRRIENHYCKACRSDKIGWVCPVCKSIQVDSLVYDNGDIGFVSKKLVAELKIY